jgi:hypothetical protein
LRELAADTKKRLALLWNKTLERLIGAALASCLAGFVLWYSGLSSIVGFCLMIGGILSLCYGLRVLSKGVRTPHHRYVYTVEDRLDRTAVLSQHTQTFGPDVRDFPLRQGDIKTNDRPQAWTVQEEVKKIRLGWTGVVDEWEPLDAVTEHSYVPVLLKDLGSSRISPQDLFGNDGAIAERANRYLATASHVNIGGRFYLMQETAELHRLKCATRFNEWGIHRASEGFLPAG